MTAQTKILVADPFHSGALQELEKLGTVLFKPSAGPAEILSCVLEEKPSILVVRSTRFSTLFTVENSIEWVIRAGSGVHPDDLKAAQLAKVPVSNCPGMNALAVAELTIGLMLAIDRNIFECINSARSHVFAKKRVIQGSRGLAGRKLGLIGFGFIGQAVARRAAAFEMKISAVVRDVDKYESEARELGVSLVRTIDELAADSDIISVHIPYSESNKGILGSDFFSKMKKGAIFINTSRAELVEEKALQAAKIKAGLDVVQGPEPVSEDVRWESALLDDNRIVVTPHIGASTEQAQEQTCMEVVRLIGDFLDNGEQHNIV